LAEAEIMNAPVFIGSGFVAKYPEGGGTFWVALQYLLGFREHGVEAYWLEVLPGSGDADCDRRRIATFFRRAKRFRAGDWALVLYLPDPRRPEQAEILAAATLRDDPATLMREGVLLNFSNGVPAPHRDRFARKVLYDIDPGMLQLWSLQWGMGVGEHDLYVTIGQSIGGPDCRVPTNGVRWHPIWPTVHLPSWPRQEAPGSRYTTITQWWNGNQGYDLIDGELYEHNKRTSFLEYIEMPRRSGLDLELAANVTPGELEDRAALEAHGWRLVAPHEVAGTPSDYRAYVQGSRGEFSCAKPSVIKASPGWISDRTICYLASGRPAVTQAAGAERHVPKTLGLQFFSTQEEALEALRAVEANYAQACRDARALAEELLSTRVVVPKILHTIGLEPSRPPARTGAQAGARLAMPPDSEADTAEPASIS
jgi:hypothetical protein